MELYHRVSHTLRVQRGVGVALVQTEGVEEGTALRRCGDDGSTSEFVSAAGGDRHTVDRLCALLSICSDPSRPTSQDAAELIDEEPIGEVNVERLTEWLASTSPEVEWVESAATVESWAGPGAGISAQRVRRRTWAMASVADGTTRWTASRGESLPDPLGWIDPTGERPVDGGAPVLLRPAAVATLMPAMVAALHGDPARIGTSVGAGWSVLEDPSDPRSLFGGSFDDVLDPATTSRLAAEGHICAALGIQGIRRRASVHDAPMPFPANIRVDAPRLEPPSGSVTVEQLHLHVLGPEDWVLEIPGARPRFAGTSPEALARGFSGAVGEVVATHRGVVTPALLLEGLDWSQSSVERSP